MAEFNYGIVADPTVFKVNTLPAHADTVLYASKEEREKKQTSLRMSLNGLWKFHYAVNYTSCIPGFESPDYDVTGWEEIHVPSNIQMEGYDRPAYVNTQYPWDGREEIEPGQIPENYNPAAQYVTFFEVPETWKKEGCDVRISFQGVESGFALWINGKYVGYSEDSFTPSEFDLTPYLTDGVNRLAAVVFKWTAGSWLEDQDMYRFSGIFRDVYLQAVPKTHIEDIRITADTDAAFKDGLLEVQVKTSSKLGGARIAWRLKDAGVAAPDFAGEISFPGSEIIKEGEAALTSETAVLKEKVTSPHLWSAEVPYLYALELELIDAGGSVIESLAELVGFRHFEMQDGIMCLNGKRIVFNGANRHEFSCDTGRTPRVEDVLTDIRIMKQNNINAVRTCHYSDASIIYRFCDIYGLYMIAESNMETHGMWDAIERGLKKIEDALPGDRDNYREMMLDRVRSAYQRDKNHPAILIWSVGNESYGGSVIYDMSQEYRKLDSTRLVHYEGVMHDRRYNDTTDMESQMYTSAAGVEKFLKENPDKPFILCEYTHSMGNSNGGMHKYIELSESNPRYQGGFIWDFVDQAVRIKNRYGEEFQGYGGDCYERPTDYDFSGNGIIDSTRRPYGKIQEVKFNYQNIKVKVEENKITVTNKNLFVPTSDFDCRVSLEEEGKKLCEAALETDVQPLSEETYDLPFTLPDKAGEYAVTVSFLLKEDTLWEKKGYEIAFGQGVFEVGKVLPTSAEELPADLAAAGRAGAELNGAAIAPLAASKKLTVIRGTVNLGVRGDHFEVLFSGLKGGIVSYRWGGRELIDVIPRPNFWRAPTSNDMGNRMPARLGIWKVASDYQDFLDPDMNIYAHPFDTENESAKYPLIRETENYVEICWKKYLPTAPRATVLTTYRVFADGTVRLMLDWDGMSDLPDMAEFGWLFTLNADFDHVTYYGMGPEENYCDRNKGARLGVFESESADMVERYLVPQETGNRTRVRWAKVTDRKGRGLLFKAAGFEASADPEASRSGEMEFSAIPYSPDMLEAALHPYELPPVHHTYVRCSLKQMGVAGDDSWGARTHDEYLVKSSEPMHFAVDIRGI